MKIYGYIDNEQLKCKYIEEYVEKRLLPDGRIVDRVVTEEEQAAALSPEWKPVDFINDKVILSAIEGEIIIPRPYDAGDHIAYQYIRQKDKQWIKTQIALLKESLANSDYKITKCYEASLLGMELPYDITELHRQRQRKRDSINELELEL